MIAAYNFLFFLLLLHLLFLLFFRWLLYRGRTAGRLTGLRSLTRNPGSRASGSLKACRTEHSTMSSGRCPTKGYGHGCR